MDASLLLWFVCMGKQKVEAWEEKHVRLHLPVTTSDVIMICVRLTSSVESLPESSVVTIGDKKQRKRAGRRQTIEVFYYEFWVWLTI